MLAAQLLGAAPEEEDEPEPELEEEPELAHGDVAEPDAGGDETRHGDVAVAADYDLQALLAAKDAELTEQAAELAQEKDAVVALTAELVALRARLPSEGVPPA
eukprot:COSAG04_NODE_602_length_12195_cov_7.867560_9_plen_103_part_00